MSGRPSKLTPENTQRIADLVRVGNYLETAAAAASVHRVTLHRWLRRGQEEESGPFPAGFVLRSLGPLDEPRALADVLHAAKLGGVRAILEHLHTPPAAAFSFAGGPGPGFNAGAIATALE